MPHCITDHSSFCVIFSSYPATSLYHVAVWGEPSISFCIHSHFILCSNMKSNERILSCNIVVLNESQSQNLLPHLILLFPPKWNPEIYLSHTASSLSVPTPCCHSVPLGAWISGSGATFGWLQDVLFTRSLPYQCTLPSL